MKYSVKVKDLTDAEVASLRSQVAKFAVEGDLTAVAREAWLYTLPLIEMETVRARMANAGAAQNTIYARRVLADMPNVEVASYAGLTVEFARASIMGNERPSFMEIDTVLNNIGTPAG